MGLKFWLLRALKVFSSIAVVFFVAELMKESSILDSLMVALIWSSVLTVLFIGAMFSQSPKNTNPTPKSDED